MSARVLILAPRGRDSTVAAQLLSRNEIAGYICRDLADLVCNLEVGAGAVLITEEVLTSGNLDALTEWVIHQETWSDMPFVVFASAASQVRTSASTKRVAELGNVVLLQRPVHAEAIVEAIRSTLKARARQYEVRDAAVLSAAQNRILELAVQNAPLGEALDAIIREVEQISTSRVLASILLLDEDGVHLRHGAAPSLPARYTDAIDGMMVGPEAGSCGAAVYRKEPVFVADIAVDPIWAAHRALALEFGLRSCWSLPIVSAQGQVLGTLALYYREPGAPISSDKEIVDFVLRTAGIVIARARTETILCASEARYRQIVEGAEEFAIVTLDVSGTITGWNSGATRLVGYSEERALGQSGALLNTPEDIEAHVLERDLDRAKMEGRATNERWLVKENGERFWGSGLTMPLADGDGGYVKIFRDGTADHEAARALRESEARLRFFGELEERFFMAADAQEAMSAATQLLGGILGVSRCSYADVDVDNDRFWIRGDYRIPGVDSLQGTYSLDLFGSGNAENLRIGRTLIVRNVAQDLSISDGLEMFQGIGIQAIICCPLIKEGHLAAMMAVDHEHARDWTTAEVSLVREVAERCWAHVQRVGSEARLRDSEERLRLAVYNAEIGFWDVDLINDRLIWSDRMKAMFGLSIDATITMQEFRGGLHVDDREHTLENFNAATDPNTRALYDVDFRTIGTDDGIERWISSKGRGVFDAAGRCLRVTGTALDISARKQAEEALRDLNSTLEARVAEIIAEREEAQEALRQSQKMEAIGQLTGGVAHDFNNLLTPIVGSLDMLQRKGVGGEREQRLISGAVQSAEKATVLVQRLLAFARRQPLRSVPVDVAKLVCGMRDLVESTTGPQIRLIIKADAELPSAMADVNQLEMALLNLAVNARDAMPEQGTLRISTSAETIADGHYTKLAPGDYVCLSVADSGTGMDEDTLAQAVEPFFSTKGIGKGTGLGLSMVHGLASQLGGALAIKSRIGEGTNAELWLPASQDSAQAPHPTMERPIAKHTGVVLLVDDEELVRMSTADMLSDLGYAVIEVVSAEKAVTILDSGRHIDAVVTDHLMPGMTGTQLAGYIRSTLPHIPVLIVSGYAELEGISADQPRLNKPFRKDELSAMLHPLMS